MEKSKLKNITLQAAIPILILREKYRVKKEDMLHIILDNNFTGDYVTELNNCYEIVNG